MSSAGIAGMNTMKMDSGGGGGYQRNRDSRGGDDYKNRGGDRGSRRDDDRGDRDRRRNSRSPVRRHDR